MEETERKQKVHRKTIREAASWSELVADLLGDIIARLCVTDRVRFRAVCRSWQDVTHIVKSTASTSTSMLPWFASVGSTNQKPTRALECRLFDSSYSVDVPVSVYTISFTKLCIPVLAWNRIKSFCKQGWLFISVSDLTKFSGSRIYFMLFSPLTKKLTQLPALTASCDDFVQTFSSDPESADCVFLLLDTCNFDDFTITTCRKGDTQWTVRKFRIHEDFRYSGAIYTRGLFYIISRYGQLASYDVIEEKIKYQSLVIDDDFARRDQHRRYRVFTRNGEFMYNYRCNGTKRFDWSNKVWIPVSSITDPPALIDSEKLTLVEDMIEILDSECLCSSEKSSLADHLMYKPQECVFNSGSVNQVGTSSFFWLEPPLFH